MLFATCGGRRGGVGAGFVDQLEQVLLLVRGPCSSARKQLPAFQVVESKRAAEFESSHEDLRVFIDFRPSPALTRPLLRAIAFNSERDRIDGSQRL